MGATVGEADIGGSVVGMSISVLELVDVAVGCVGTAPARSV